MKKIGIGLIGTGNMARFHMQGYHSIRQAYGEIEPRFVIVSAPHSPKKLEDFRRQYGFERCSTDWHDVVKDPAVEAVLISAPNYLHAEMVIAAANAGKHVMCEKPMSMTKAEGIAMCEAVAQAGVISLVDFVYLRCPAIVEAHKIIENGELGELISFRGWFDASYMSNPHTPIEWRGQKQFAGTGAMGDVVAHIISLSDFLVNGHFGGMDEVCAAWDTVITERPDKRDPNQRAAVDTDDLDCILIRYKTGRLGVMYASRVAAGHDTRLGFEILGSKGSVKFGINRMNELILFKNDGNEEQRGFKTLYANTKHGEYEHYCLYNDVGVSYADVVGMQAQHFLHAIASETPTLTDVQYRYHVDRVMEAMQRSIAEHRWVKLEEVL
ncbi:MAG: Gfo/Idh/MocA family oxidoreductase [Eubacteriales bacterium]|nr:Gfo/Idh/MocA family oxidoreductase [Eubacteriales bacterium]